MPNLIWQSGTDMKFNYFNNSWLNFTGQTPGQKINYELKNYIHNEDINMFADTYNFAFKNRVSFSIKLRLLYNDKTYHWVMLYGREYFDMDGKFAGFVGSGFDIDEIETANNVIRNSIVEKESLLKEIHHRVKNNLQIISDILLMVEKQTKNEYIHYIFCQYRARIDSMSIIHENIYNTEKFSEINYKNYIINLIKFLFFTFSISSDQIEVELDIEEVIFDISIALPCGLLLNEIIMNALLNAFPDNRKGKIIICLKRTTGFEIMLSVQDNGIGLPDNFKADDPTTLGFKLIKILTQQLGGELEIDKLNGTKITVRFLLK
jgi:two-component sensor histidine kinase